MASLSLKGLEFFGYHGHQDEEQKIGNRFSIDVKIKTNLSKAAKSDHLKDTINYADVYEIVKQTMEEKHRLLEHVADNIIKALEKRFPEAKKITIRVSKLNPPIGGICKKAVIKLSN